MCNDRHPWRQPIIAAAWKMFWSMKHLLMNQKVSINRHLQFVRNCRKLCHVVLQVLDGESRGDVEELRQLEVAWRSMLRKIVGERRGSTEEWVDWIKRATQKILWGQLELAPGSGFRFTSSENGCGQNASLVGKQTHGCID